MWQTSKKLNEKFCERTKGEENEEKNLFLKEKGENLANLDIEINEVKFMGNGMKNQCWLKV